MSTLRLAFAGTPALAADVLDHLCTGRHPVVGVLSQPDRPRGRGRRLAPTPVKAVAEARGLPVAQPARLDAAGRAALAAWAPDVLVVVAYGLLLPPPALALPRLGCLNLHYSLLPRWRGAAPVERAIMAGDTETGVTVMQMDAGLDTGPVFASRRCPITADSTADRLATELTRLGCPLLDQVLDGLAAGTAQPTPQPSEGATYAHKLEPGEAELIWDQPATVLDRHIRALGGRQPAFTWLPGDAAGPLRMRVLTARPSDLPAPAPPGTILAAGRDGLLVACGDGALNITRVQLPRGKGRPLDIADALNGWPDLFPKGARLGVSPAPLT